MDEMDADGHEDEQRNQETETEEQIEAETEAEMNGLRNMLDQVGRRDFLEGLFTLLKALNSLIGYMKAMNRHVGKIDEEISNHTKLLHSMAEQISTLAEKKAAEPKASPNIFQGSCSQHASAAVFDAETPSGTLPPRQYTSKVLHKDPETLDEVKKRLDMSIDLTVSDDDKPNMKPSSGKEVNINKGGDKVVTLTAKKRINKSKSKGINISRGKHLFKSLEVDFDVSDSDPDDCTIIESPTNPSGSLNIPAKDKTKDKGKQVGTRGSPASRPRKIPRSYISLDKKKSSRKIGHVLPKAMDTKFSPTVEMLLTIPELHLCAYVFQLHGNPR
ncbi:uncharacterized protein LOC130742531 [Lotus japonicus]|uniref:uncharacterized protein LOC130742531 n=1 Tax=Lotus japonicus TaxID=34305 RepID=UPI002590078A|nr:uncharacterized protein LOC130742531 [Lotus japonicus]